jgi:phosphocarrier protein HPr
MILFEFQILSKLGMHARPAAKLTQALEHYDSTIMIGKGRTVLNGKSLMGMIALKAKTGDTLKISIEGPDEKEAEEGVRAALKDTLGEGAELFFS